MVILCQKLVSMRIRKLLNYLNPLNKEQIRKQYYLKMILHYKDNFKNMANYEGSDWQKQTCQ